jgi:hypothetical protein
MRVVNGAHPSAGRPAPHHAGLRAQQIWLSDAVTEPNAALDAARMLTPGPRLTATERLEIYRGGYRGRLVECLADDYPAVRYLLGKAAFETIAHAYIDRHPSRSPNLNAFGRWFPDFLATRNTDVGTFPPELARLEWAIVEAIHAAASPPLTLERLERVTPQQWAAAILVPAASVRVLRFTYPVDSFYQAFRNDEHPTAPAAASSATLVHRRGWVVWRSELTPAMARLLEAIGAGSPLGEALASSVGGEDPGAQASVTRWFQEWVSQGVFTAVELPAP